MVDVLPGGGGAFWGFNLQRDPVAPAAAVEGHLKPGRPGGDVRSAALEAHGGYLPALVEEIPDLTLEEIRDALAARGMRVSVATVWRFFERHQITRKKRQRTPPSRTGPMS